MKYAYLASSLPVLIQDESPQVHAEAFLFHCTGALDAADQAELGHVLAGRPEACTSEAARQWFDFDTQVRNAAAEIRAKRHGVDPKGFFNAHQHFHGEADRCVVDAFAKTTPREREWVLDQARWAFLDELAGRDPFGFPAVLAHAVKLVIAQRWSSLDAGRGAEILENSVQTILQTTETETA